MSHFEPGRVRRAGCAGAIHDLTAGTRLAGDQEVVCHNDPGLGPSIHDPSAAARELKVLCEGYRLNNRAKIVINTPAGLPVTGVQVGLIVGAGVVLLVAGAALFVLTRRRKIVA